MITKAVDRAGLFAMTRQADRRLRLRILWVVGMALWVAGILMWTSGGAPTQPVLISEAHSSPPLPRPPRTASSRFAPVPLTPCGCSTEASTHARPECVVVETPKAGGAPALSPLVPSAVTPAQGLFTAQLYVSAGEQALLAAELDQFAYQPYVGKVCKEFGMPFSFYVPKTTSPTIPPVLRSIAHRLHRDGFLPTEPNYVLVNMYEPGEGIWPHVDDAYYEDGIASLTLQAPALLQFRPDFGQSYWRGKKARKEELQQARETCGAGFMQPGTVFGFTGEARYGWTHEMPTRRSDIRHVVDAAQARTLGATAAESAETRTVARRQRVAVTFRTVRQTVIDKKRRGEAVPSTKYY